MEIEIKEKQIIIDDQPRLLLLAEFHYYRTDPEKWQEKIDLIKEAGCNGIASYIPWLLHEYTRGDFDFVGRNHPRHNLVMFLDMVKANDLYFVPRPGPFIMAEMKNEGIPYWVYDDCKDAIPVSWNNKPGTTPTLDYLEPTFLAAVDDYYRQIIGLLAKYQYPSGNIIGLQLDNEIGMLSWVSNKPDLTDLAIKGFVDFVKAKYDDTAVTRYPFIDSDFTVIADRIRKPSSAYLERLHFDLGYYSRERYSSYIDILISMAQKYGLDSVPYIVNIHGCSAGRSLKYPIGISQLYQSYRDKPGVISGSDVYLHAVDVPQFTDVFMANVLTDATNASWQPLTSMEFSAGDGDYGNSFGNRYPTSRSDFMTRMFVMHGNRLLNYYSFVGGTNYRFTDKHRDSNDRIANTGEEHGFAAPISPNGIKSYTFDRMAATIRLMRTHEKQLAVQSLVTDDLVYGFIPDYFMTEYHYPDLDPAIHKNLERCRTSMWDTFLKALLLRNYIYTAINIQDDPIPTNKVLLLDSARYMNADIQAKIVNFLISGGRLLLSGEVPQYDLEGERCTLLMDHLGLKPLTRWEDARHKQSMSIMADNFALGRKELHRGFNHTYIYDDPKAIMFRMYDSGEACGFKIKRSGVDAFIVSCPYRADLDLVDKFMASFHIRRRIRHDYETYHGIVLAKTEASDKSGYIHVINLDDFAKEFTIFNEDEQPLSIYLEANSAKMLPFNVSLLPDLKILRTDSEIIDFNDDHLTFKLSGPGLKCSIATSKTLIPQNPDCHLKRTGQGYDIELIERRFNDELLTLRIEA